MYGSTSYEYTDVLVAREMEKDYFGSYFVTEIFRYGHFLGSNRSQRESKCGLKQGFSFIFLIIDVYQFMGVFCHTKNWTTFFYFC